MVGGAQKGLLYAVRVGSTRVWLDSSPVLLGVVRKRLHYARFVTRNALDKQRLPRLELGSPMVRTHGPRKQTMGRASSPDTAELAGGGRVGCFSL